MANHLTKGNIDKLTSKIMYSSFEHGQEGCEEHEFYSNLRGAFEQSYKIYDLHKISDKILKALCFIYNRKRNHPADFKEELCWYLYYWLGEKIYPKVQREAVFSNIIKMIYTELYSNTENFIICNLPDSKINQDIFNKNKVLFDYSKDYVNIYLDTLHGKTTCDYVYKEYIRKYIKMYKEAYSDCYVTKENNFDCNYFSTLFQESQYNTLSSFSCKDRDNFGVVLDKQKEHEDQEPAPVLSYRKASFTFPSPHHIAERDADLGTNKHPAGERFPRPIEPIQMDDTAEGGSSKTIAGSIVPVLGVSSFSLLLYKVTPVGGYINRLLGRNRNVYNNIEYMDAFNPYNDGMVPGDRRLNISYHRI
ncbi:PIR protein [Plasmodium vivax]|uniref:VIR protein n=1 Tax=Plasmodium vivax TaxID=5855 RepID=A0A565A5Z1_PLAVI|nr:PIR protein [Plasmodium vivax]